MDTHTTNDETLGVRAHVLCKACDRVRNESRLIKWLGDPNRPQDEHPPIDSEEFYHSWNLDEMLDAAAGGCHLCTMVHKQAQETEVWGNMHFSEIMETPGAIFVELRRPGRGSSPVDIAFILMEVVDKGISPDDDSKLDKVLDHGREADIPLLVIARLLMSKQQGMV